MTKTLSAIRPMKEYERQTVTITLAAALEAVARVLIDDARVGRECNAETSRKILMALGFKYGD